MRILLIAAAAAVVSLAQDAPKDASKDPKVLRGKYLVEEVARCTGCHTPKLDNGDYIKSQWMKGATIPYTPVVNAQSWKSKSPDVTANSVLMKRWGDEGMTRFLETGKNPRGNRAGNPMPAYNLTHEDAEAVTAFLKTLQ